MTINRDDEHLPTAADAAAFKALTKQFTMENLGRLISVTPVIKDFKDALDKGVEAYKGYKVDFLLELIHSMYSDGELDERENIEKLTKQLNDDVTLSLFIGHCKEVADQSNSRMAKLILAVYAGRVITEPELIQDPVSGVIIDVLSSVNDFDLLHFEDMFYYLNNHRKQENLQRAFEIVADIKRIQSPSRRKMLNDFKMSIKKFINMGVFDHAAGSTLSAKNPTIESNDYSVILYELCQEYRELYEIKQEEPS